MPRGQTTWPTVLSGLDGPLDTSTRLSLFGCTATSAVVTQTRTFTHSIFNSLASQREAKLFLVTGSNIIKDCRPNPPPVMGWGRLAPFLCQLNVLSRPVGAGWDNKDVFILGSGPSVHIVIMVHKCVCGQGKLEQHLFSGVATSQPPVVSWYSCV